MHESFAKSFMYNKNHLLAKLNAKHRKENKTEKKRIKVATVHQRPKGTVPAQPTGEVFVLLASVSSALDAAVGSSTPSCYSRIGGLHSLASTPSTKP